MKICKGVKSKIGTKEKEEILILRKSREGLGAGKGKKGKICPIKHLLFTKKSNSQQYAYEAQL